MFRRLVVLFFLFNILSYAQAPGTYKGTWNSGANGNTGKLTLAFEEGRLGTASFDLHGEQIKAAFVASKGDGHELEFTFEYDLDGNRLRSRLQGTLREKTIKGTYRSSLAADSAPVDEGTWEVTRQ